jgi:hypothetical protein
VQRSYLEPPKKVGKNNKLTVKLSEEIALSADYHTREQTKTRVFTPLSVFASHGHTRRQVELICLRKRVKHTDASVLRHWWLAQSSAQKNKKKSYFFFFFVKIDCMLLSSLSKQDMIQGSTGPNWPNPAALVSVNRGANSCESCLFSLSRQKQHDHRSQTIKASLPTRQKNKPHTASDYREVARKKQQAF